MADLRLYDLLGVSADASTAQIKKAYRKLARALHPDLNPGDAAAERRFKEVSAAHEVLSDPEKRALYDEFGEDSTRMGFDPEQARAHQRWARGARATSRGRSTSQGDIDDLLGQLFGDRGAVMQADVRADLTLDFRTAVLGGQTELRFADGRSLRVRIPPGVRDGETIRLRGQGTPGRRGAPAGDLLITIHVGPHPVFRREDDDLHMVLPVTVGEAIRGGRVRVPTLSGDVDLTLPPDTQTGRRLRLTSRGVQRRDRPPGDLYVEIRVHIPEGVDPAAVADALNALDTRYPPGWRARLNNTAAR